MNTFLRSMGWVVVTMMTLGILVSSSWQEHQKVLGGDGNRSLQH